MYIYKVGCHTFDESPVILLKHLNYYTQEQFEGLIFGIVEGLLKDAEETDRSYGAYFEMPLLFENIYEFEREHPSFQ